MRAADRPCAFDAPRGDRYNGRMTQRRAALEIDLVLDRTDDGPVCQVRRSPGGQGESRFAPPFRPHELQQLWRTLAAAQSAGNADPTARAMALDAGKRLFEAAFVGEVLGCLRVGYDHAAFAQAPLRYHVDLSATPDYESLPWELLYHPERAEFVSLTAQTPFARYMGLQQRILPVKAPAPMRLLVVVAGPAGYPRVDVDREWIGLLDTIDFLGAARKLIVERLHKPTLLDLQRKLRQSEYHLVHLVAHGLTDKQTGEGQLVLEDEMGRSRPVSGQHLGALMRDHFSLRGIVLAAPAHIPVATDHRALMDVARRLVRRGLAAVVAPQLPVNFAAWLAFCRTLYTGLADCAPVDEVVTRGRLAMTEALPDFGWVAPVLLTRSNDGVLFDDGSRPAQEEVPDSFESSWTARFNSLRIRTASREAMARWGTDTPSPPRRGRD